MSGPDGSEPGLKPKCPHGVMELTPRFGEPHGVFPCWFCLDPASWPTYAAPPTPVAPLPNTREARIAFLERKREAVKADLLLKFEDGDHHGVADAAMDLRDIESELKGLRF